MKTSDKLPTVLHYRDFLRKIIQLENISLNEARKEYGQFSYSQWNELFKQKSVK